MAVMWIVSAFVWFLYPGVQGDITVTTTTIPVGLLGNNEVELVCTYSLDSSDTVFSIGWTRETSKDSGTYQQLALLYPPETNQIAPTLTNLTDPSVFGRVVLTNPTDSSLTAKMKFTSVVCGDERKYQCDVLGLNNGAQVNPSPASVTSLIVKANPKTTLFNEVVMAPASNVEEGQTIQFTCTGNVGRPAGTFLWTKYSSTTDPVGVTIRSTTQTSPSTDCTYTGSSVVNIPMTKDDNGIVVRCILQQELITDPTNTAIYKQTSAINVFYKARTPTIAKDPNADVHYEDTTLTLTCAADGNPPPTYIWRVNGAQVSTAAQIQLTNIKIAQSGDYVCEASNNFNGNTYTVSNTASITIETPPPTTTPRTTTPPTITTPDLSLLPTSGGSTKERTCDDGESVRMYTAGVVMLCISMILLLVTAGLGVFISRNKGLPCFKTSKMEESVTFQTVHPSGSASQNENERSQYQQLDSTAVAGPSVYQALGQPPTDDHGQTSIDRTYEVINDRSDPSRYDEMRGTEAGNTRPYINIAFSGDTFAGRT